MAAANHPTPRLNNTSFAVEITETFNKLDEDKILKKHQNIVVEYIKNHRGLLVQHDLGTGKSLIAAAIIADQCSAQCNVIFLSARTLHDNMEKALTKYIEAKGIHKPADYKFVTMNASNMIHQLIDSDDVADKYAEAAKLNLNGKILIVDEAHNLFNSITNGSANATGLYTAVMRSSVKVIFLTGTPIVNHPFELVPCYNMIAGKELFPPWDDFNLYFIDEKHRRIKNRAKFQNRIVGMTSYYGSLYSTSSKEGFPKRLPIDIRKIQMSSYQWGLYAYARELELAELSFGATEAHAMQKPQGLFTSSYKRLSRQISNIAFPKHAIKSVGKKLTLLADDVTDDDLLDVTICPKWHEIVKVISGKSGKQLVYSAFVENAGVNMFARLLDLMGWSEFTDDTTDLIGKRSKHKYIIISGETPVEERYALIDEFNRDDNATGKKIAVILISGAGAEGLDLKAIRHIHIMEPYWNWARIEQVIGRGERWKSHEQLPPGDNNIEVHMYLSVYPDSVVAEKLPLAVSEEPTEVVLYEKSVLMREIIESFYQAIAEAAIDCAVHNRASKIVCRLCTPTGERLYEDNFYRDMKTRSPCKPMKKIEVSVKKILVDGIPYAWYKDPESLGIVILEQRDELGGYVEMPKNNPLYPLIREKLQSILDTKKRRL